MAQLEGLSTDLYAALDHAGTGIILFQEKGECAFINRAAKRILDGGDGVVFSHRRLVATHGQERSLLEELIRRSVAIKMAKKEIGAGTVRITRKRGSPLLIRIAPFPSGHLRSGSQFAAIALIGDPDRSQNIPINTMGKALGLTDAESKLALLLVQGMSVVEAAEQKGVTKETVRSQLKSIFSKTGSKRQAELIRLLAAFPTEPSLES